MNRLSKEDLKKIEIFIKEAGEYLLSFYEQELKTLSLEGRDIKLEADQALEKKIKNFLLKEFNYPVLGEEFGATDDFSSLTGFVIDPIDGTMNFSRKNPIFCISIGFVEDGNPVLGVIYNPILKELVSGLVGKGAWFNGELLEASSKNKLKMSQSILATGFPTKMDMGESSITEFFNFIKKFKKVRMIGSAAQSLAWLALGRVDCYYEKSIMYWDVVAGLAISKSIFKNVEIQMIDEGNWKYTVLCSNSINL